MVSQVPIIGILMIVNGVICILYGIFLMAMGPVMQLMFANAGAQGPPQQQMQMQQMQQMMGVLMWVYVALGAANAVAGVINIIAGIPTMRYRRRTFAIVALFANVATFGSCYCLPTSLGLMIWGLIVMFQKDVADAFKLGDSGCSVDEIKGRFSQDRYDDDEYDDDRRERRSRRSRDDSDSPSEDSPPGRDKGPDGIREL